MAGRTNRLPDSILVLLCVAVVGCAPDPSPQTGSQTNWLTACQSSADCGEQSCHCGVCTQLCDADSTCDGLPGSSCVAAEDPGVVALCDGAKATVPALCLPRCSNGSCATGQSCIADVCNPSSSATAQVVVDTTTQLQELTGIGATLAYAESSVIAHPQKNALFEAMFSGLGLDILRLRNRFGYTPDDDLTSSAELVAAATNSLGHPPTVVLTSWSPPAALKANGSLVCQGNTDSCTLTRLADGSLDYAGYAEYWRASLDAYAATGVAPNYVGMQNNPDFVPSSDLPGEGCRFLPTEYAQALDAVVTRFASLQSPPKIIAPEASTPSNVGDYVQAMDVTRVDALGHHLYGIDPSLPDTTQLSALKQLGSSTSLPLFQTEMQTDGFGSAVLLHHTFVTEGASAYLHGALVGPLSTSTSVQTTMITLDGTDFELQTPYYALRHYAAYTDPGWFRVPASSSQEDLLASAWLSPTGNALTLVLVNASLDAIDVNLGVDEASTTQSRVYRTVFDGIERFADLGELSAERVVRLPSRSVATIALTR